MKKIVKWILGLGIVGTIIGFLTTVVPIVCVLFFIMNIPSIATNPFKKVITDVVDYVEYAVGSFDDAIQGETQFGNTYQGDCQKIDDFCYTNFTIEGVGYRDVDFTRFWNTEGNGSALYQIGTGDLTNGKNNTVYGGEGSSAITRETAVTIEAQREYTRVYGTVSGIPHFPLGSYCVMDGRICLALPACVFMDESEDVYQTAPEQLSKIEHWGGIADGNGGTIFNDAGWGCDAITNRSRTVIKRGTYVDLVLEKKIDGTQFVVPLMYVDAKSFHHNMGNHYARYTDPRYGHLTELIKAKDGSTISVNKVLQNPNIFRDNDIEGAGLTNVYNYQDGYAGKLYTTQTLDASLGLELTPEHHICVYDETTAPRTLYNQNSLEFYMFHDDPTSLRAGERNLAIGQKICRVEGNNRLDCRIVGFRVYDKVWEERPTVKSEVSNLNLDWLDEAMQKASLRDPKIGGYYSFDEIREKYKKSLDWVTDRDGMSQGVLEAGHKVVNY